MIDISNLGFEFNCPECSFKNTVILGQVKKGKVIKCGGCKKSVKLIDNNNSVNKTINDINEDVNNLLR